MRDTPAPSRRLHDLAKEWGLEVKDLAARLEKVGIRGKRAQSALSEEEIAQASRDLGLGPAPTVTIGGERIVTSAEGQQLVERRVGSKVIRRRASAPTADIEPWHEPLAAPSDAIPTFGLAEPLMEPEPQVLEPLVEETEPPPAVSADLESVPSEPAAAPPPVPPVVKAVPTEKRVLAPMAPSRPAGSPSGAAATPARPAGPRVLGRIDLKKAEAERVAALERPSADRARRAPSPGAAPMEVPPPSADPSRTGKKKKRRVIEKPEFAEIAERETRQGRLPRKKRAAPGKEQRKTEITTPKASKRVIRIGEFVSVGDLARSMGVKAGEVVKKLMEAGTMATINQVLDLASATLMANEFGYTVENATVDIESAVEVGHEPSTDETLRPRPPVVTIMGHVDHGKTSLLDAIRESNVTDQEAGGITQHIGAYRVDVGERQVTFLDTPGHEAFTAMRARGAKVTDLVVLVVAADDGVMPQTVEAINHAKAANVPIVVAINKIDKPDANTDRVKQELSDHALVPEDWGGDTICVPCSARSKVGLEQLLEMILLQSEVLELRANPDKAARGTIVEAQLDRGRGPVATVLVQEGTLRQGDAFVCGAHAGRVRAMIDDRGHRVTDAGPAVPVEILGLTTVPDAGAPFVVVGDEATARQVAEHRRLKQREASLSKTAKVSLEDLYRQVQAGDTKELRVVVKADVQGSVEAVADALARLSTEEVKLAVLHASVGGITESDIMLAVASNAVVIGFNVRPETKASQVAEREGVDVRLYTIIYEALNDVRDAMEGLLEPTFKERTMGRAEVRNTFTIPGAGMVAGCFVVDGKLTRNAAVRLVRDHVVVHTGKIGSLRRFKDDVREVQVGYECGVGLDNYQDVKVGDVIEAYEMEQVARRLGPAGARAEARPV
jgi:translation initiation factor IF-2